MHFCIYSDLWNNTCKRKEMVNLPNCTFHFKHIMRGTVKKQKRMERIWLYVKEITLHEKA